MKTIKRTVAALLATLMLATSTSFTLAAEVDVDDLAIAKVNAAGIMTGTDKGFEPEKSLTRAEAAAIIVRMKGISEATVKSAAGTTNFDDVAATHWAAGYINQASNLGIVKGVSATSFAPDKEVTVQEMVTMAVRALGAGTLVDSEGTWPSNYINFAAEEGLLDGVAGAYASVSTRLDAARVVANSLEANMWVKAEADTNSKITYKISGNTILNDVLNIDYQKGMVVDTVSTKDRNIVLKATTWADKDIEDYTSKADLDDYEATANVNLAVLKTGDEIDVWFKTKSKEIVGAWASENSKQSKVAFTEIVKDADGEKLTLKVNDNEKKYTIDDEKIVVYYNGVKVNGYDTDKTVKENTSYADKEDVFGTATLEAGKITGLYLEEYTNFGIVKEIKKDKVYYEDEVVGASDELFKFNFDADCDDEYVITKDGKEVKTLEEGDAIEYYQVGDTAKYIVNVLTKSEDGTVTSISDDSYLKLDGTKYNFGKKFELNEEFKTKDQITVYLNADDEVVMATIDEESMDSTLGFITSARRKVDDYGEVTLEFKVTSFDKNVSDVLALDKVKTYDKVTDLFAAGATTNAEKKEAVDDVFTSSASVEALLGRPVRYNISNNKLVITEIYNGTDEVVTAYTEAKIVKLANAGLTVLSDRNKIGDYKVTDNTVIFSIEDGDEDYERKIATVDYDDLKDQSTFKGYAISVDKATNKVDYFVSTAALAKDTDDNYAVVKSIATSTEDEEVTLTLFTADGTKEIACDETEATGLTKGMVIKYNKGDKITDIDIIYLPEEDASKDDITDIDDAYVVSFNGENIKYADAKTNDEADCKFIDCEEDLIILTFEGSYPTSIKATDKLPETGSLTSTMDGAKAVKFLVKVVDNDNVVYGLIYEK